MIGRVAINDSYNQILIYVDIKILENQNSQVGYIMDLTLKEAIPLKLIISCLLDTSLVVSVTSINFHLTVDK